MRPLGQGTSSPQRRGPAPRLVKQATPSILTPGPVGERADPGLPGRISRDHGVTCWRETNRMILACSVALCGMMAGLASCAQRGELNAPEIAEVERALAQLTPGMPVKTVHRRLKATALNRVPAMCGGPSDRYRMHYPLRRGHWLTLVFDFTADPPCFVTWEAGGTGWRRQMNETGNGRHPAASTDG